MASLSTTPFLLHTTEEHYFVGIEDLPATLKVKIFSFRYALVLAYVCIALGLGGVAYEVYEYLSNNATSSAGALALRGWVMSKTSDDVLGTYTVSYRYTIGGQTYIDTVSVDREAALSTLPGAAIDIWAQPDSPDISGIDSGMALDETPVSISGVGVIGGLTALFGGLLAYGVLMYRAQYHRLFRNRQIITGEIAAIHEHDLLDDHYQIEIHARFTAPDTGAVVKGVRRYRVDLTKAALIPEVGTGLRILYLNPYIWEIL